MKEEIIAIVPSAGVGRRLCSSEKKPFVRLAGIPLLVHTLKSLQKVKSITEIIPSIGKEDFKRGFKLIEDFRLTKIRRLAIGGRERQDSVYNALRLIEKADLVLIHDGARPLITSELVEKVLTTIMDEEDIDGVIPGLLLRETIKEIGDKGFVLSTKDRGRYRAVQTPQVFHFDILKRAYKSAYEDGFYATDDSALVERIGGKIKVIEGDPFNIKVTTREDLKMAEYLLTCKK